MESTQGRAMNNFPGTEYLKIITDTFKGIKRLGDRTFEQLSGEEMVWQPDEETNSIAINVQHLSGNMRSRFSDFLTTDGEKPDRNRDTEFELRLRSREEIVQAWEAGWKVLFDTLASLTPEDLSKEVLIRTEPHSVVHALERQIAHYGYHVGQLVMLGKMVKRGKWKTLSIPRGKSSEFVTVPFKAVKA
jgi:hypothetical protein